MKTFATCGILGCASLALIFITTSFAADKSSVAVGDAKEPRVTVQTDIKFTRKLPNGKTETTLSPSVRSFVGQSAVIETTMPNGETVTVNIATKTIERESKDALPVNESLDVK
jgi:hypothetical protein